MIMINPEDIRADFPAVTYVGARPTLDLDTGERIVSIHHGDEFAVPFGAHYRTGEPLYKEFQVFTIIGYAVQNAEDPFKAYEQAKARGQQLIAAFGLGAMLTDQPRLKKRVAVLDIGQRVKIEGQVYNMYKAPNDNVAFTPAL